jgi:transposase
VSATAAGECIRRARRAGLGWPLPEGLTDEALERRLYTPPVVAAKDRPPQPEWAAIHRELRRPGVTLQLLCEEHRAAHPDRYGYSRYVAPGFSANQLYSEPSSCSRVATD